MEDCKRYLVQCIGISNNGVTRYARNYSETTCSGEVGRCGCIHAEQALLSKLPNPAVIFVSTSPCISCAISIVRAGVEKVIFQNEYLDKSGIEYLVKNGVLVYNSDRPAEYWDAMFHKLAHKEALKYGRMADPLSRNYT